MPVKSSKSATPTTPRKTRTRKTNIKTKTAKVDKVIKEVQAVLDAPRVTITSFKGGKVVAKKTTLKRPSTARLITWERYRKDISTRWAIHNFEIQELLKDFSKGFEAVKPYHAQVVKFVNK